MYNKIKRFKMKTIDIICTAQNVLDIEAKAIERLKNNLNATEYNRAIELFKSVRIWLNCLTCKKKYVIMIKRFKSSANHNISRGGAVW